MVGLVSVFTDLPDHVADLSPLYPAPGPVVSSGMSEDWMTDGVEAEAEKDGYLIQFEEVWVHAILKDTRHLENAVHNVATPKLQCQFSVSQC